MYPNFREARNNHVNDSNSGLLMAKRNEGMWDHIQDLDQRNREEDLREVARAITHAAHARPPRLSARVINFQHVQPSRLAVIHPGLFEDDNDDDGPLLPLGDVLSFFSAVLSRNNSTIIQELGIQASIEQTPDATFNGKHLKPLFALRNLTTLQILQRGMHASDSRLPRPVSSALPRAADPRMTLDADLFRLPPTLRNSLVCVGSDQCTLEVLKVGPAPIVDPQGVASFLPVSTCSRVWACIPAMANWRGIDRERTLDEVDANIIKSWHMGGRRPR
ncbi:hypothetical protein LXA43DRAFT_1066902 [Ganoderma leucocontextum]|nr:hypothetical protein LXA43DRAFT_1066902 [Ganoderma leucocontextum]